MALDHSQNPLSLPVHLGRKGAIGPALASLGACAFGRQGAPLCHGMAIISDDCTAFAADHSPIAGPAFDILDDPVLSAMGLHLITSDAPSCNADSLALPALLLRVGLLGRILDLAHGHLKSRVSMGKKTLSHQLVKASFSDAYSVMRLCVETAGLRHQTGDMAGLDFDHARLTTATLEAEKLMGGHGYLIGGTHQWGYVSMLLQAIYGPRP
jgi:hypothetical protein